MSCLCPTCHLLHLHLPSIFRPSIEFNCVCPCPGPSQSKQKRCFFLPVPWALPLHAATSPSAALAVARIRSACEYGPSRQVRRAAGVGYLPLLPEFRRLLPGIGPVALVASVVFFVPLIRDFCSWAGFRQARVPRSQAISRSQATPAIFSTRCTSGDARAWVARVQSLNPPIRLRDEPADLYQLGSLGANPENLSLTP